MLTQVRVLKPGGKYVYITFAQPHFRKPILLADELDWTFELRRIGEAAIPLLATHSLTCL